MIQIRRIKDDGKEMVGFVASVIAMSYLETLLDTVYDFVDNFKASSTVEIEPEALNI